MCRNPLQAESNVVAHVAMVAVGVHSPWPDADVDAAQRKSPKVDSGVPVVGVFEDGEEVFGTVARDLDVS
jgi:hypothetical protein